MITHDLRWSLPRGNTPVPSRWQATRRSGLFDHPLATRWRDTPLMGGAERQPVSWIDAVRQSGQAWVGTSPGASRQRRVLADRRRL